ncbi:MAG: hypothetical protein ABJB66_01205 [Gemmatimonadaceae bacterium]
MRLRVLFASIFLAPAVLAAQGSASHGADFSLGLTLGTLGIGVEANKLITSHVGVRAGLNFFNYNTTRDEDDLSFDAKIKFKAFTGLVDLYPGARGKFHFTGGIMTNPVEFTGVGRPSASSTFKIDDVSYTAAQVGTLNSVAKFSSVLPYVGMGIGTPANSHKGVKIMVDFGVGIGQPTLTLTATGAASNAQLAQSLKNQEAKTQTDLRKYVKAYPVSTFTIAFAF